MVEDTDTDTLVAIEKYDFLKNAGVRLIVGPFTSANVKALKPLADADGILLVSPASVANSLAVAGDNVFRLIPDVNTQGEALSALLLYNSTDQHVPVVRDDLWGMN